MTIGINRYILCYVKVIKSVRQESQITMIAILENNATDDQIEKLTNWFEEQGMRCQLSRGEFQTILGIIGDTSKLDTHIDTEE